MPLPADADDVARLLTEMGYRKVGQRLLTNGERHMLWYHPENISPGTTPTSAANARLAVEEME